MQGIFCSLSRGEKQCDVFIFCFVRFYVRFLFTWFYFYKFLFFQGFISVWFYIFVIFISIIFIFPSCYFRLVVDEYDLKCV